MFFVMSNLDTFKLPSNCYDRQIMLVGASFKSTLLSYNDNYNKNISDKNHTFCELTGLYNLWRNYNFEFYGLEHYRRFFCVNGIKRPKFLSIEEAKRRLETFDVIIPYPHKYRMTLKQQYEKEHFACDLELLELSLAKLYPDYKDSYNHIMNGHYCSLANMFVGKKDVIDSYCEFLFNILFDVERNIDLSNRDVYQSRVFGFLSERLFNVWLYHNRKKLRIDYCYVNFMDKQWVIKKQFIAICNTLFSRDGVCYVKHIK